MAADTGFPCDFISLPRCEDMYRFYCPPCDRIIYRPALIGSTVAVSLISAAGPGWKPGRTAAVEWTILAATGPRCPTTSHRTAGPRPSCISLHLFVGFIHEEVRGRGEEAGRAREGVSLRCAAAVVAR